MRVGGDPFPEHASATTKTTRLKGFKLPTFMVPFLSDIVAVEGFKHFFFFIVTRRASFEMI